MAVHQSGLRLLVKLKQVKARIALHRRQVVPQGHSLVRRLTKRPAPMVDARLLAMLEAKGVPLHEISVEVLGLSGRQSSRLSAVGIRNMQQLSNCSQSDLFSVPRFGVSTVGRIKAKLNSYLRAILNGSVPCKYL